MCFCIIFLVGVKDVSWELLELITSDLLLGLNLGLNKKSFLNKNF